MNWKEVTEDRYTEMLEILPPIGWCEKGFLVGEPWVHKTCAITKWREMPAFAPFIRFRGKYYESDAPMTVHEFREFNPKDVLCTQEKSAANATSRAKS